VRFFMEPLNLKAVIVEDEAVSSMLMKKSLEN
jgi:hypothetical protein